MHTPPVLDIVSQDAEFDSWSRLTTVTSFDAGTTQPVDEMEGQGIVLQDVKCFSSTSLLVESLIEQLCKLLEKDQTRQKKLYNVICRKLHQMKLIDETYQVEEFEFMRSHYQKALFRLLSVAKSTAIGSTDVTNNALVKLSTSLNLNVSSLQQECLLDCSRYNTEFEELEYIAKGGFGRVHKARNRLDGSEYAIKKICLRYRNIESFLRSLNEVKMLAKLNHPNIVSYKAAWLEPFAPSSFPDQSGITSQEELTSFLAAHTSMKSSRKVVFDSISEEDSWGVEFKDSKSGEKTTFSDVQESVEESVVDIRETSNGHGASVTHESVKCERYVASFATLADDVSDESESDRSSLEEIRDGALCEYRHALSGPVRNVWKFEKSVSTLMQREWATLFIQMQLCKSTLRHWLDRRNDRSRVDVEQALELFRQVVRGVEYIHSQNIVHHDIKPSNIFVNEDLSQVQVGDFGLACCLQHSTPDVTFMTERSESGSPPFHHKGEVGTRMYAAREQLAGKCDPKSDIYSLGIVLFELLQPFSTDMERSKVIGQLKAGQLPPALTATSPKLAQLIRVLLSTSPESRPTAHELSSMVSEILSEISREDSDNALLIRTKDDTIQQLLNVIAQKDREIEELRKRVLTLEVSKQT